MRLTILTLAHDVYRSQPGQLLNITGIYTGLAASQFPFTVARLLLVARFTGAPHEYGRAFEVLVTFLDEDGLPGPIPSDQRVLRMAIGQSGEDVHAVYTLNAPDITFVEPGWYEFHLHVDGELLEELPVHVARAPSR